MSISPGVLLAIRNKMVLKGLSIKALLHWRKPKKISRPNGSTLERRKGGPEMYTDYGYIGTDGVEYATVDEAVEAGAV